MVVEVGSCNLVSFTSFDQKSASSELLNGRLEKGQQGVDENNGGKLLGETDEVHRSWMLGLDVQRIRR